MTRPKIALIMLGNPAGTWAQFMADTNLGALANKYQNFTNYRASTSPSLPGYLKMTTGSLLGHTGESFVGGGTGSIDLPCDANNVLTQLVANGFDWRVFAQQYDGNPDNYSASHPYYKRHDPATFFNGTVQDRTRHQAFDDSMGAGLISSIGVGASAFPDFSVIIPNANNGGYDSADMSKVGQWVTGANPYGDPDAFPGAEALLTALGTRGVVILAFDGDWVSGPNPSIPFVIMSAGTWPAGRIGAPDITTVLNANAALLSSLQGAFSLAKFTTTGTSAALETTYVNAALNAISFAPLGATQALVARVTAIGNVQANVGDTVKVTAAPSSSDGTHAITGYQFDWGDGTVQGGATNLTSVRTHVYTTPGSYTVTVTVTDSVSATATATVVYTIKTAVAGANTGWAGIVLEAAIAPTITHPTLQHQSDFLISAPAPAPTITNVIPNTGSPGTTGIGITGTNFTNANSVKFNGIDATFIINSATSITASVPAGATTGPITVTANGITASSPSSFVVTSPPPTISGFSPTHALAGTQVTISGGNFINVSQVLFNGVNAPGFIVVDPATIKVNVPAAGTTGKITVSTALGGSVLSASIFTVDPPVIGAPRIDTVTPNVGLAGTTGIVIAGANFATATSVKFNGTSATFVINNDNQITATVPAGAAPGPITVTSPTGTGTSLSNFLVPPTVSGLSPSHAQPGTQITISGGNFTGATAVKFNGISAVFSFQSDSSILANVPLSASSGPVTVTTASGTGASPSPFTVDATSGVTHSVLQHLTDFLYGYLKPVSLDANGSGTDGTSFPTIAVTIGSNDLAYVSISSVRIDNIDPPTPTLSGAGMTWAIDQDFLFTAGASTTRWRFTTYRAQKVNPTPASVLTIGFSATVAGVGWTVSSVPNVKVGSNGASAIVQSVPAFGQSTDLPIPLLSPANPRNGILAVYAKGSTEALAAGPNFGLLASGTHLSPQQFVLSEWAPFPQSVADASSPSSAPIAGVALELAVTATTTTLSHTSDFLISSGVTNTSLIPWDTPQFTESLVDTMNLGVATLTPIDGGYKAVDNADIGKSVASKSFQTFSNFRTLQFAGSSSDWRAPAAFSDDVISLVKFDHLLYTQAPNTHIDLVTGQYLGAGGGNVLQFTPTTPGAGVYGPRTAAGLVSSAGGGGSINDNPLYDDSKPYDESATYDGIAVIAANSARTSVFARVFLPQTANGTYELRLYRNGIPGALVKRQPVELRARTWEEIELIYQAGSNDDDFTAELVQIDTSVSEPWALNAFSIFQHPIRWEVSNDGGSSWQPVVSAVSNPDAYVTFPTANNQLMVRAIAVMAPAVVNGWTAVPWYINESATHRAPIDYSPPWGISDRDDLLAAKHKPLFSLWHHYYPRRFSLVQIGSLP